MSEHLTFKDRASESRIYFERVIFVFVFFIFLSLVLLSRYFYLQVIEYDSYRTKSDKNRIQTRPLPPTRGLIFDRNGVLIADNMPTYVLTIVKERAGDIDDTLVKLHSLIKLTDEDVRVFQQKQKSRHKRPYERVPIRYRLSEEEIALIAVNRFVLPGVEVNARLVRNYPQGELVAHAVGSVRRINEQDLQQLDKDSYAGMDHVGKIGVEKYYEKLLVGKAGVRRVEINAYGRELENLEPEHTTPASNEDASEDLESTAKRNPVALPVPGAPVPGVNLTLHLDVGLQQAASDALGDRRGVIVAIEPETGGIMALVSKPSYDPNPFVTGIDEKSYAALRDSLDVPLFNRALQGQYEPGSTIKPFIGLVGLNGGVIDKGHTITDPGWFKLPDEDRLYRDWNWTKTGGGGHGKVNFRKAIYRSCNIYFYELALKIGIDRLHEGLGRFGFGVNGSFDLPEAGNGLLPSREWKRRVRRLPWFPGDTINIGIGQGDMLVTPFQLAVATSVLANRGKWVQPRWLKSGPEREPATNKPDDVSDVPDYIWDAVFEGMGMVVHRGNRVYDNGTAWSYIGQDIPYRMAGKSGTAQVVGIKQGELYDEEELDERQRKHAWFIAFAPVDDPKIAIAVLVENGGGGSSVAAPVARKVIDYHLLKNIQEVIVQ